MSHDYPDRSKWLAVRATLSALSLGKYVWIATRPINLGAGRFGAEKVQGTYRVGANALKRRMGKGKQRVKARKALQRAERAKIQGRKEAA